MEKPVVSVTVTTFPVQADQLIVYVMAVPSDPVTDPKPLVVVGVKVKEGAAGT